MGTNSVLCSWKELSKIKLALHYLLTPVSTNIEEEIICILLQEPDFVKLHLSLFYPFTPQELEQLADKIFWGSLSYTTFVLDIHIEPLFFADIGLSFNKNLSFFCSWQEVLFKYRSRFSSPLQRRANTPVPLDLAGELGDRFATRTVEYSKISLCPDFRGLIHADSIAIAWDLYYYQGEDTSINTLKVLLHWYGTLAAFSKPLWDDLLVWYITPVSLDKLMAQL